MSFLFFEIFIFWAISRVKRAKNYPKWKKQLHPTRVISLEQYNICSLFLVHLFKMLSPGYYFTQIKFCVCVFFVFVFHFSEFFIFFFKFLFFMLFGWRGGAGGGKRTKNCPQWQTFCLLDFMSQEPYMIWSWLMVHV